MAGNANIPYECVESPLFDAQANELGLSPRVRDNHLSPCLFAIARVPEEFPCIAGTTIRRAMFKLPNGDDVRIWFDFNVAIVRLLSIEKVMPYGF